MTAGSARRCPLLAPALAASPSLTAVQAGAPSPAHPAYPKLAALHAQWAVRVPRGQPWTSLLVNVCAQLTLMSPTEHVTAHRRSRAAQELQTGQTGRAHSSPQQRVLSGRERPRERLSSARPAARRSWPCTCWWRPRAAPRRSGRPTWRSCRARTPACPTSARLRPTRCRCPLPRVFQQGPAALLISVAHAAGRAPAAASVSASSSLLPGSWA